MTINNVEAQLNNLVQEMLKNSNVLYNKVVLRIFIRVHFETPDETEKALSLLRKNANTGIVDYAVNECWVEFNIN